MSESLSPQELIELWLVAADAELAEREEGSGFTDERRAALNRLVIEDPESRRRLIALSRQQAWLMWHGKAEADAIDIDNVDAVVARITALIETAADERREPASPVNLRAFLGKFAAESGVLLRPPLVLLTLLMAGLIGAAVSYQFTKSPAKETFQEAQVAVTPATPAVAYFTSVNGVTWGRTSPVVYAVGGGIQAGDEIAINEGIVEFRLANGVYFSVEGPASLVLGSPSSVVLQYGKLTAHVPWTVLDLKLISGACRITACDANFGLVESGNRTEVHVFSGSLQVEGPHAVRKEGDLDFVEEGVIVIDDAGAFAKGTVTEGNSLTLSSQGPLLKIEEIGKKANPEKFAAKMSMAGVLPVTKAYTDAVLESKPVGYWRFESVKNGTVANEIAGGGDLQIVGNVRLTGGEENSMVEFQPRSGAYLASDPFDDLSGSDYSLEVWVKPSHLQHGVILSLHAADAEPSHATTLELQGPDSFPSIKNPPGSVRYVHDSLEGTKTSCFSKQPYDIRRWQHLVAVKEGARMRLYVDGKLSSTAADSTALAPELRMMLGWMPLTPTRSFIGQMDEVAIYNRALTEQEIARHYGAVKDEFRAHPPRKSAAAQNLFLFCGEPNL